MVQNIPVLMYHRVDTHSDGRNTVILKNFIRQIEYLKQAGYSAISMMELYRYATEGGALPPKPVLLSFDDGYVDNYDHVLPVLRQYGMKGIIFPVSQWVGELCGWKKKPDSKMMSWEQLRHWHDAGMEVGAHTVHHVKLSTLTETAIQSELQESKSILEDRLGVTVDFLCYPYGDFDIRVQNYAKEAGYKAALAIFQGVSFPLQDLYAIPRIGISAQTALWEFRLKVSRLFPYFVGMRQLENRIKTITRR